MSHFPVSSSNLSATHICLFLQHKYGFPVGAACSFIRAGINDTYVVAFDNQKFIFRVYCLNWRTENEITEEIRLLNILKANNIPVSYPLADINNNYIQQLNAPEGDRYAVLFSFAPGEKLLNYPAELHFIIGQLMAGLHITTLNLSLERTTYTPNVLLVKSLEQLSRFLPADTTEMEFMQQTQQYLLNTLSKADISKLRTGAVHMDIWFDNLNIDADQSVTFFDFDFCGNGWLCLDMAYYILQVHSVEKDETECALKVDSFLKGYQSVTPLSVEEKRLLPMLGVCMYLFYLGVQCSRFENWSNSFLNENYLKRYINVLIKKYFLQYKTVED